MEKKLIKLTSYIRDVDLGHGSIADKYTLIKRYAELLRKPLTLGLFIPTDLEGNILYQDALKQYQEALDRVIFEGMTLDKVTPFGMSFIKEDGERIFLDCEDETIEDLVHLNLTLKQG